MDHSRQFRRLISLDRSGNGRQPSANVRRLALQLDQLFKVSNACFFTLLPLFRQVAAATQLELLPDLWTDFRVI